MAVNPFELAKIYKTVEQAQRQSVNQQKTDKMAAGEFVGQETEIVDDMMREKERAIAKILGKQASGMGGIQALGTAATFMNPLAGGIVSGLTSLFGGSKQRKHAKRQIKKARLDASMPEKYAKSWLGKRTKGFQHGYATKLDEMAASLPSSSDIFKSALMSGIGSYVSAGVKDAMTEIKAAKAAGAPTGLFTGGLDLWGQGIVSSDMTGDVFYIGKPLFGEGNLLENLISGKDVDKKDMLALLPILQLLQFK